MTLGRGTDDFESCFANSEEVNVCVAPESNKVLANNYSMQIIPSMVSLDVTTSL